jgi:hypothetical protein
MTAEIAIMNKTAIALAADSAVTLGRSRKIFNTVNKLFTLSKHEPVGVMIFGNSELLNVPWENLVKMYRAKLKNTHFGRLELYAQDFIKFLSDANLFPPEQQRAFVIRVVAGLLERLRTGFEKDVQRRIEKKPLSVKETDSILKRMVEFYAESIEALPFLPQLPVDFEKQFETTYGKTIADVIKAMFPKISAELRTKLSRMGIGLFTRVYFPSEGISGVVIAGFGRDDLFPALCHISVHGVVMNWVKCMIHPVQQVGHDTQSSSIHAFAQQDVVETFINGIDNRVKRLIEHQLESQWAELEAQVAKVRGIPKDVRKRVLGAIEKSRKEKVFEKVSDQQQRDVINPILSAVGALPKDELAAMAESLVNLTVFRRKFSMDAETVGGPVDVAVISKWDGFIWIRRKHYFNKDLNPHFVAQYFTSE